MEKKSTTQKKPRAVARVQFAAPEKTLRAFAATPKRANNPVILRLRGGIIGTVDTQDEMEVITVVKAGIPARDLYNVIDTLHMPQEHALRMLGIAKSTASGKLKTDARITPEQSERLLGLVSLVKMVHDTVEDSNPEAIASGFDAATWLERWITKPLPAINNKVPADLMDTMVGQALVTKVLRQALEGSFA